MPKITINSTIMEEKRRLLEFRMPSTGELLSFRNKQYYVTDTGLVYDGYKHEYVKQHERKNYMTVALKDNEDKWHTRIGVHNLVATVFQRLLEKGEVVHHISHVKSDNRIANLKIIPASVHARQHAVEKWQNGTMDGNGVKMKKAWKDGRMEGVIAKLRNIGTSRPARQVAQMSLDGKLIKVWPSTNECGRNGFDQRNVSRCCRGVYKTHKGFKWQYLEEYLAQQPTVSTATVQIEPIN